MKPYTLSFVLFLIYNIATNKAFGIIRKLKTVARYEHKKKILWTYPVPYRVPQKLAKYAIFE